MKAVSPLRTALEGPQGESLLRRNGVVYTPERLSEFVAKKLVHYYQPRTRTDSSRPILVVDPAVGDGMLLTSVAAALQRSARVGRIELCGIDIDPKALQACARRMAGTISSRIGLTLVNGNALLGSSTPPETPLRSSLSEAVHRAVGFDMLVANPPWGADLTGYRDKLNPGEFVTLKGQVDSYELFVELATKIVRPGGVFGFIIPDSILNHGKSELRAMLVSKTSIRYVARLGERLFPGINRGCAILVCTNRSPREGGVVDCFRLTSSDRRQIIDNTMSFSASERSRLHRVRQSRFLRNPHYQFDIDVREDEASLLSRIRSTHLTLGNALSSSRGVELGSAGRVCECPHCGVFAPVSERSRIKCIGCGEVFNTEEARESSITSDRKVTGSVPLITGTDLRRYDCNRHHWLILGKTGINYKTPDNYLPPKILVRKTGVGFTAALDYTPAYTTQVVYILRELDGRHVGLEFFLGLVNSRLYHFVLSKSFGELEWRSHPYLTQSQIASLPLPELQSGENSTSAQRIVRLLRHSLKDGALPPSVDAEVESLVGGMFGLDRRDYSTIFEALQGSDNLVPMKALKNIGMTDLEEFLE